MTIPTQQPKCLQDIVEGKDKLTKKDILQLTTFLLKQGKESNDLRKNLHKELGQDAAPVNIVLCLYTAIINHNADSKTKNAAIESLFNSYYNHDFNDNKYNVDKKIFLNEIATILQNQELISQNEAVTRERETERKREAENKNATLKAIEAAKTARNLARLIQKQFPSANKVAKAKKQAEEEARKAAAEEEQARKAAAEKARKETTEQAKKAEEEEQARKAAAEKARKEATEQAKKAEEEKAKQEEAARPLQQIIDLFSYFILPTEKQKDNPPKHETPPSFNVPSLSEIEQNHVNDPTTTAQQRFKKQRKEETNQANNPMNFIKQGLQGLYKGITNIFTPEKGKKSEPLKASNSPAAQCRRGPGKPQGLPGFRNTLEDEVKNTRRQPGRGALPGVARRGTGRDTGHTHRRRAQHPIIRQI